MGASDTVGQTPIKIDRQVLLLSQFCNLTLEQALVVLRLLKSGEISYGKLKLVYTHTLIH